MRGKFAAILFVVILAFLAVFSAGIFHKLFIEADNKFRDSTSAAFLGAFLAFLFVRIGDALKAYSDRTTKNHSTLVKLEYAFNGLLTSLDDNVYLIEKFEIIYQANVREKTPAQPFVWANRLHQVAKIDDLIIDLLNIDFINELFTLNVGLRKLNDSMDTINGAYLESKDAFLSGKISLDSYLVNLKGIHDNLLHIKKFHLSSTKDITRALAAARVLAKKRPLMGYLLRSTAGYKYGCCFSVQREEELLKLQEEISKVKKESKDKIDTVLQNN